jgi:hypothetical protein
MVPPMKRWQIFCYLAFAAGLSWLCFIHPTDNLDRVIYEALVRGRVQPLENVYPIVKHESPRTEASSVLDSPVSLGQLEPLYAIKPIYVEIIDLISRTGLTIQRSISLLSSLSLFGIAVLLLAWTRHPLYSALLMANPEVLTPGRMGTPDAFSACVTLAAFLALIRNRLFLGVLLLLLSVWIRTDNVLLVVMTVGWLAWERKVTAVQALVLAATAAGSVVLIDRVSANYSWAVLFRFSFIAGKFPAQMASHVSLREYLRAFGVGLESAAPRLAIGFLFGALAWSRQPQFRPLLMAIWIAAASHFLLFPSPETRYLLPTYLLSGCLFITAIDSCAERRIFGTVAR